MRKFESYTHTFTFSKFVKMANNLNSVEMKAFVPAKNYQLSKQLYRDMGFTMKSDGHGVAYFSFGNVAFLLQDFYDPDLAKNFMIHLLVENATDWHKELTSKGLAEKYEIEISQPTEQPWRMTDFTVTDPSGVRWRIANNTNP
jgi:uncharacterized glyoxalase superfamily protein PhnB